MSLVISNIESLAQDRFTKNGITKQLHIVAKNIAFTIHVESTFNLNKSPLTAKLVYDFEEGEPREVETLKVAPLESTSHVNETGDKASVEVRIGVLSSQHEGAYFRVKLSATNPETNMPVEIYSHPLKIISKRNQVKKILAKQQQQQQQQGVTTSPVSSPSPPVSSPISSPTSPLRTSSSNSDIVTQVLLRLEEQQRDQGLLLQKLCNQVVGSKKRSHDDDFEVAFQNFLDSYRNTSPEERSSKIRKVLKNTENQKTMTELTVLCSLEGLIAPIDESLQCVDEICPHKKELENLDTFYSQFLTDSVSNSTENPVF